MVHTFTPGPWLYQYGAVQVEDAQGISTTLLRADRDEPNTAPVERDQNVQLASFAPEMLDALLSVRLPAAHGPMCTDEPGPDGLTCVCWMGHVEDVRTRVTVALNS